MTENERLKAIRKYYNLSQEKFGEKIGLQKSQISRLEKGQSTITEQVCISVCQIFKIRYEWLKKGEGVMLESDSIDELASKFDLDSFGLSLIREYMRLSREQRAAVQEYFYNVVVPSADDK